MSQPEPLSAAKRLVLDGSNLTCGTLVDAITQQSNILLQTDRWDNVRRCRSIVDDIVVRGISAYALPRVWGPKRTSLSPKSK